MPPASQTTVLYDDDCGFCRVSVALLLGWDRRRSVRPVTIQSDEGQRLLASVPEGERLDSAHAVGPDGIVLSGGDAAPLVFGTMPGGWPLARVAKRMPGLARSVYRAIAASKGLIGPLLPEAATRWADRRLASRA